MVNSGKQKSVLTAYLCWFFAGQFGAHKFYLGRTRMGVLYGFTLGLLLVGLIYDLFTLPSQVRDANAALGFGGPDSEKNPSSWRDEEPIDYAAIDEMIARHRARSGAVGGVAAAPAGPPRRSFGRRG